MQPLYTEAKRKTFSPDLVFLICILAPPFSTSIRIVGGEFRWHAY